MINARDIATQKIVVDSNLEELTEGVYQYLDPALTSLHSAMLEALDNHPTRSLYEWLYEQTDSYLKHAPNAAISAPDYLRNYCVEVQEKIILQFYDEPYKSSSHNKKELFQELIKFYKTIILLKSDIGKRVLAMEEEKTTEHGVIQLCKKFELVKENFKEPQARIAQLQNEIEESVNQYRHADVGLMDRITQRIKILDQEESQFHQEKIAALKSITDFHSEIKKRLLRQKSLLDIIPLESIKFIDIEPCAKSLKLVIRKQALLSFHSKWCSKKPNSILDSIKKIKRAATATYGIAPVCNEMAFKARREKIDMELDSLEEILLEIQAIQETIQKSNNKTVKLTSEFEKKKSKIKKIIKNKLDEMKKNQIREEKKQLELDSIKPLPVQVNQKDHFILPKMINYFIPGVVSEVSGIALTGLAISAFMSTTPLGWGIVSLLLAGALFSAGAVFLTKSYHRYKKNKLLGQYDEPVQKKLYELNEELKEKKIGSSTRHLMMNYNISMDNSSQTTKKIPCVMNGKKQPRLFLNIETKRLHISSIDGSIIETVDAPHFQAQLQRLAVH